VFTGEPVVCVEESICLCDGYGFCFGGPEKYQEWRDMDTERQDLQKQLDDWIYWANDIKLAQAMGEFDETMDLDFPPLGQQSELEKEVFAKDTMVADILQAAIERGKDPRNRALEAGRPWKEGDGF
jgi:hypothetical protein